MQNKFTGEISKGLESIGYNELKKKIDNLHGQNWIEEIRELSPYFFLDAEKIIKNVKYFLAEAIDGETLKKELEENKDHYQKYYEKMKHNTFNEAKEIIESLLVYIEKVKQNTGKRLTHVLLANPGIENRMPVFMKNVLGEEKVVVEETPIVEEAPVVEEAKEIGNQDEKFMDEIIEILHKNISEEEKSSEIKDMYQTVYGKNMVLKVFYKKLGLTNKEDIQARSGIDTKIVELLILIKKNPDDTKAKADLERKLHPAFITEGEKEIQRPGVTIVGTVDLSTLPKGKEHKKHEIGKNIETMQAPTTNPLDEVGKTMTHNSFLDAHGLTYEELRKSMLKNTPVAGRYVSYNPKPLKDGSIAHFFTVGFEKKGVHDRLPINVFVAQDPNMKFDDGKIYKVQITGVLLSNKTGDNKQTYSVQGELVIDKEVEESIGSGNFIGGAKGAENLQKLV
ncbi:MAG: hypothetical protein WCO66_00940 [Candidatus Absconditabacteria bacterium]